MKTLLTLGASALLTAGLSAQTQLPASADQTLTPGAMPANVVTAPGARATTACDDFNRATGLGTDWAPAGGTPGIFNDMFGSGSGNGLNRRGTGGVARRRPGWTGSSRPRHHGACSGRCPLAS